MECFRKNRVYYAQVSVFQVIRAFVKVTGKKSLKGTNSQQDWILSCMVTQVTFMIFQYFHTICYSPIF